jgi:hypothetical protein
MKTDKYLLQWLLLPTVLILAAACQKSISDLKEQVTPPALTSHDTTQPYKKPDTVVTQVAPYPQAPLTGCAYDPSYGDSIIYPQPTTGGQDYIVRPVNNPGPGKYLSWPIGMVIDSLTGAIDVTKSETGERYAIGFVKSGTTDTCLSNLIIGGDAYFDSVYVIANGQTQALPYFEANATITSICSSSADGCAFDITGSAASKKVVVNPVTGAIDLAKTLNGPGGLLSTGAFGLLPLDGATATATIYYKLNDASNMAIQHIDVQFAYYGSKASINAGLLGGLLNKVDNVINGLLIDNMVNPRPPLIIITRRN